MRSTKRVGKQKTTAVKLGELGAAVPQVVSHRLARMAMAGPHLSERDKREFTRMVLEKHDAFTQAWTEMLAESLRVHHSLSSALVDSLAAPLSAASREAGQQLVNELANAPLRVVGKGLNPIHKRATMNARRLAKTKLR